MASKRIPSRTNFEASFFQALEAFTPELAERVRAGQREERSIDTGDIPNDIRALWPWLGPSWRRWLLPRPACRARHAECAARCGAAFTGHR